MGISKDVRPPQVPPMSTTPQGVHTSCMLSVYNYQKREPLCALKVCTTLRVQGPKYWGFRAQIPFLLKYLGPRTLLFVSLDALGYIGTWTLWVLSLLEGVSR